MGEHKTNPNSQLAREGKLPPKVTASLSKRETEKALRKALALGLANVQKTGYEEIYPFMGKTY